LCAPVSPDVAQCKPLGGCATAAKGVQWRCLWEADGAPRKGRPERRDQDLFRADLKSSTGVESRALKIITSTFSQLLCFAGNAVPAQVQGGTRVTPPGLSSMDVAKHGSRRVRCWRLEARLSLGWGWQGAVTRVAPMAQAKSPGCSVRFARNAIHVLAQGGACVSPPGWGSVGAMTSTVRTARDASPGCSVRSAENWPYCELL